MEDIDNVCKMIDSFELLPANEKNNLIHVTQTLLSNSHESKAGLVLLESLQRLGFHHKQLVVLYSPIFNMLKSTLNAEEAVTCLTILNDLAYYQSVFKPVDAIWLMQEVTAFSNERAYKLAKANYLSQLFALSNTKLLSNAIESWIATTIERGDDEMADLLAFAMGLHEVLLNCRLQDLFDRYMMTHPDSETAHEMVISIARVNKSKARAYITRELSRGHLSKPLIEAALNCIDKALAIKLLQAITEDRKLFLYYEADIKALHERYAL